MLNRIIIMGRLTRDPELRHTQSGTAVASFSLAVDRDFKNQNGEKETDFIDVVAWRNSAEFVSRYFTKGRMAVVEGRLQIRPWQDRDGNKRRSSPTTCTSGTPRRTGTEAGATRAATPRTPTAAGMAEAMHRPRLGGLARRPEAIRHPTTAAETSRSWAMTMTGSSRSDLCGPSLRAAARHQKEVTQVWQRDALSVQISGWTARWKTISRRRTSTHTSGA